MHINEINIKNRVYNYYFDNLNKTKNKKQKTKNKKIEPKYILINLKIYKDLTTSFTRYGPKISIKMLKLHYHELMGKLEECEGKNI